MDNKSQVTAGTEVTTSRDDDLEWIPISATFSTGETTKEKMIRKFNENPFVPIGCLTTATVLCIGLYSFRKGNTRMSQLMMRARIAAQGFTVVALMAGVLLSFDRTKK